MSMATIFSIGNLTAATGWLALLVALFMRRRREALFLYAGALLPTLLASVYVGLLVTSWIGTPAAPDFGSLAGVKALFATDAAMTAGWHHYLAFDLFVGTWIARDGLSRGLWPIALAPILILTFMLGPAGLLTYLGLRAVRQKVASPIPTSTASQRDRDGRGLDHSIRRGDAQ
jgi:hypothetical protein